MRLSPNRMVLLDSDTAFSLPKLTIAVESVTLLFVPVTVTLDTPVAVLLNPVTALYWLMSLSVPFKVLLTPMRADPSV